MTALQDIIIIFSARLAQNLSLVIQHLLLVTPSHPPEQSSPPLCFWPHPPLMTFKAVPWGWSPFLSSISLYMQPSRHVHLVLLRHLNSAGPKLNVIFPLCCHAKHFHFPVIDTIIYQPPQKPGATSTINSSFPPNSFQICLLLIPSLPVDSHHLVSRQLQRPQLVILCPVSHFLKSPFAC